MGQTGQIVERKDMRIVGGDHEVAFLACECPHRRYVRIDQSLEQLRQNRLGRTLLAGYRQQWIRAAGSQCCQEPSHHQDKVVSIAQIEERDESLNGPAWLGDWKWQHARRSPEAHRRRADDAPAIGADLDGAPEVVGEIEIDLASMLGEAHMY